MASVTELPSPLRERLRAELTRGETVTWAGQPDPGRMMRLGWVAWVFFLPWTVWSLGWMLEIAEPNVSSSMRLQLTAISLPFLLAGLAGLTVPYWMWRRARATIYAITNHRVLVIEGTRAVKTYQPSELTASERTTRDDGSGDMVFRREEYIDGDGDRAFRRHGFYAVEDVKRVEALITALRQSGGTFR